MSSNFQEIQKLEGNLSPSHTQEIRANSSDETEYLENLKTAHREHREAVESLKKAK